MISDTSNTETPKKEKKTYTVEEIAEQLCVSKKVAYALVKSGQFAYVRAGRAIRAVSYTHLGICFMWSWSTNI